MITANLRLLLAIYLDFGESNQGKVLYHSVFLPGFQVQYCFFFENCQAAIVSSVFLSSKFSESIQVRDLK